MKKAIYTAVIGNYDNYKDPIHINDDYDYFVFTDNPGDVKTKFATVIKVNNELLPKNRLARMIKVQSHNVLKEYDLTVWHDANIQQKTDMNIFVNQMTDDLLVMRHPDRKCIYREATACKRLKKDDARLINYHVKTYKDNNYKENNGLAATGLLIRKNTERIRAFNQRWWQEIRNGSHRDQLSFNYCLQDIKPDYISFNILYTHFNFTRHRK